MQCRETQLLLGAFADGELDLVRHAEVEAHVSGCPACREQLEAAEARRAALRGSLPRFTAPAPMVARIRASLGAEGSSPGRKPRRLPGVWPAWGLAAVAASLALAVAGGYRWGRSVAREDSLFGEALSEHVRSLQVGHLTDVVSSDQHTVKPWFIGKLDFSPPVCDLADLGFPLVGGRLDRLDGRGAAALVFRRRLHAVNLFIWPDGNRPVGNSSARRDGYGARAWSQGGLNFLAVSEIPEEELEQFVAGFRARIR
jgi:anti-sigma factor RsiW